jgi:hypothetical protein
MCFLVRCLKNCLALGALVILMLALTGCPLLLAGSLAGSLGYEAYKYKKTGTLPGLPSNPKPSTAHRAKPTPTPSADDIE